MITCNSHPRIMFPLIDWLSFEEKAGCFEIGRPRSRGWKNFGRSWGVLEIGQFSWTSCVYCPKSLCKYIFALHINKANARRLPGTKY